MNANIVKMASLLIQEQELNDVGLMTIHADDNSILLDVNFYKYFHHWQKQELSVGGYKYYSDVTFNDPKTKEEHTIRFYTFRTPEEAF